MQSTITPDEGRNVPWHYHSIGAVDATRATLLGIDGIDELLEMRRDGAWRQSAREIKERAVLFLEEMLEQGGYAAAVAAGQFVDSGCYPERNGDGIARDPHGGVAAGSLLRRHPAYGAPVCGHFGDNVYGKQACEVYGGCSLCNPEIIQYVDELDPQDNVHERLEAVAAARPEGSIKPEVEWAGDGTVCLTLFIPESEAIAAAAAIEIAARLGLRSPAVINRRVMHPAEGTMIELKGSIDFAVSRDELTLPDAPALLDVAAIETFAREHGLRAVAGTVGKDEHSVGLHEIIDIKHGGIEGLCFHCINLGTSVPVDKLLDAAVETAAQVVLMSTIVSHHELHRHNMRQLSDLAVERGVRDRLLLIAGGPQVTDELARDCGLDAGFGRGTSGRQVASFIVRRLRAA